MHTSIPWQLATITAIRQETPTVRTFTFALPARTSHRAGQHVDLRLRAPDGYVAQRSYSIGSAPGRAVELTIERLANGEVSRYLHDVAAIGDRIELRGPIGGHFVWEPSWDGSLLLVGGGSGVVPLMSMLRHRQKIGATTPAHLLLSARTFEDLIYRDELEILATNGSGVAVTYTLTREQPAFWTGYRRRIDPSMLAEVLEPKDAAARYYVCGPTPMVEAAANGLVDIGVPPERIRTERFGPTGD